MVFAVIDQNSILRQGLHIILGENFTDSTILQEESVESFAKAYTAVIPDVVIFILQKESEDSNESHISLLKRMYKKSAIVICGYMLDVNTVRNYFRLGMNACIAPKTNINEFIKCIMYVMDNKYFVAEEFQELILSQFFMAKKPAPATGKARKKLSARESEIAELLINGHRTSWIALKLGKKTSTISTIKGNIFKKLNVENVISLREILESDSFKAL